MKKFVLIPLTLLCFLMPEFVYSQNDKVPYVPPSPNAASLLEYASIPVSLSTGTAQVSVPLLNLNGRKLTVPVSISYHASGIKVQDISSSTGLGWALNAGGVITRVVRGIADESTNGYLNSDFNSIMNDPNKFGTTETTDTEPDIFFYNFNGRTGRLVFDPNQNVIQLPENNLKITSPDFASSEPKWEITDLEGIKYVFGKTSASRETTTSTLNYPILYKTYISSWYLSEIIYPFETEKISFSYQAGNNVYYEQYRQYLESRLGLILNCTPPPGFGATFGVKDIITQITINSPKYVSSITSTLGSVQFSYLNDRLDLSGALRLTQVTLKNINNDEIKSYRLENNDYFVSQDCSTDCKRLKLNKLVERTNGTIIPYKVFDYNSSTLPSRKSVKYDHWGYYNNNSYPNAIPTSKPYTAQNGTPVTFGGADKNPDLLKAQSCILYKITNSSGGIQEIFYELNEYEENGIKTSGALRVSKIIENDGASSPPVEKVFRYRKASNINLSSGVLYRKNTYDYLFSNQQFCPSPPDGPGGFYSYVNVISYSTSLIDLFDIGGVHINYSDVQIHYSHGGREELFFTNFLDRPDDPVIFISDGDPDGPPFISKGDRSYERGLLKEHIIYNAIGKKVKRILNTYDFYLASSLEAPGGRIMPISFVGTTFAVARRGTYKHLHRGVRYLTTTEESFDQLDDTKLITSTMLYAYNPTFSNLIQSRTNILSDGTQLRDQYKYAHDYYSFIPQNADLFSDGIFEMGKSRIMTPIETLHLLKNKSTGNFDVISGEVTTYVRDIKQTGIKDVTRKSQVFKLKLNEPLANFIGPSINVTGPIGNQSAIFSFNNLNYKKVHSFESFDDYGNLLSEVPESGERFQYTWGYNNSLVTSVNKNPGSSQHLSQYYHKALIGLTSVTDSNLENFYYSFDDNNRLKLVIDDDNNLMTRYNYNYKNDEANDLAFYFNTESSTNTSNSIRFQADGKVATGTTLIWDFGEGSIKENGLTSELKSYSTPGNYVVKLATKHPEYPTSVTTKTIRILPVASAQITAPTTGTNRTVCGNSPTTCTVSIADGPYNYQWEYQYTANGTGNWQTFGTNSSTAVFNFVGVQSSSSSIRCKVTDPAGNSRYSNYITINHYCSGQPGGQNDCPSGWTWNAQLGRCDPPQNHCDEGCFWNGSQCICY